MFESIRNIFRSPVKDRWLATSLSYYIPGLGQLYSGRKKTGILIFSIFVLCVLSLLGIGYYLLSAENYAGLFILLPCGFVYFLAFIFNLIDSYRNAGKHNEVIVYQPHEPAPFFGIFLNFIFPGLGYFVLKKAGKGIIIIIIYLILNSISDSIFKRHGINNLSSIFTVLFQMVLLWDVLKSAVKQPENSLQKMGSADFVPNVIRLYIILFIAIFSFSLLMAFSIRADMIQSFKVPTGAMQPTLRGAKDYKVGDHIFANKANKNLKRGDLAVFKYPVDPTMDFIKRVIGLPGETLEIRSKKVFIDGKELAEPWLTKYPKGNYFSESNNILPSAVSTRDNFGPIKIPEGCFFVMGDNRDNSSDSRFWGVVDKKFVEGKAFFIYYPTERIGRVGRE